MLDDFFVRALLAGIGVALVAGPFGCFIVWRGLAYYGDTLSHSALLGIALGILLNLNLTVSVFLVAVLVSVCLLFLQNRRGMSADSMLGLLSHTALACGLVVLAAIGAGRIDLPAFLFGDILSVSETDLAWIFGGGVIALMTLGFIWRRLFAATVNRELAAAEGMNPAITDLVFMLLLALVIAIAMKVVGVLLITAMLILPAVTARRLAASPESMALVAVFAGAAAVAIGLWASLEYDTPSGPSIVVAAAALFVVSLLPLARLARRRPGAQSPSLPGDPPSNT